MNSKITESKPQEFDPETGHLIGCIWDNSKKSTCACSTREGYYCLGCVSKQSCLNRYLEYRVRCYSHYARYCQNRKMSKWDPQLSVCANLKCDEKGMNITDRKNINHANIQEKLGMSAEYNHISDSRKSSKNREEYIPESESEESEYGSVSEYDSVSEYSVSSASEYSVSSEYDSLSENDSDTDTNTISDNSTNSDSSSDDSSDSDDGSSWESISESDKIGILCTRFLQSGNNLLKRKADIAIDFSPIKFSRLNRYDNRNLYRPETVAQAENCIGV